MNLRHIAFMGCFCLFAIGCGQEEPAIANDSMEGVFKDVAKDGPLEIKAKDKMGATKSAPETDPLAGSANPN